MAAEHQQRRPGVDTMGGIDGAIDEAAFPSTPYSAVQAQREQLQMQFQQQLQAQQQHMHHLQLQQQQQQQQKQSQHSMDGIGPAASTLMQVHSGNVEMQMTSSAMQPTIPTQSVGGFLGTPPMQQQRAASRGGGTVISGGEEPGMPQLYKTSKMRRPELWQFIRLVVPDPPHLAAGRTYTNQDAKEAYCLKCKRIMHYNTGSSNNVSRHMAKFHAADLASYAQKMADKKIKSKKQQDRNTYIQASGASPGSSGTSSPGSGHKRRRTEAMSTSAGMTMPQTDGPRLSLTLSGALRATEAEDSKEELTQEETERLNAIVARWVAKHHHPFSITEDPELQELLRFAATLHKPITLPPPSSVRASVQSLSARTRMDLMRQISSEVLFYSMASEVWITSERDVFVSFSIHYLTENFERRHFTLDVREHSGHQVFAYEIKKDMLDTLISRWDLDPRYLSSMLWQSQPRVDDGANAITQPRTQQAESAAHGFEIILAPLLHGTRELEADGMQVFFFDEMVNNAVASVPSEYQACVQFVRDQVTIFRDLAFFLTNHPRAVVRLSKLMAGTSQQRLVTDSKASWISTLDMLKRLVKKRDVIHDFFAYADTSEGRAEFQNASGSSASSSSEADSAMHRREPTDEQWCAIECLLQLLQPFENVALAIGKEKYAGSSLTFPLLKFLKRDLEKVTNFQRIFTRYWSILASEDAEGGNLNQPPSDFQAQSQNIATQLEVVRNFLYSQFKAHFSRACGELMWVSQLDPRFVRMKYLSDEEREVCKARLIDQCFVLANFNQMMVSQRMKVAAAASAVGSSADSSSLDPSSASFLDFQAGIQPTREDHDTNSFLRELLFDDAHDDPALVYQQQQQQLLHQQGQLGDSLPVAASPSSSSNANSAAYMEQEAALRMRVVDEVKRYYDAVAAAKVAAMRDPLKWWRDNTATFPLLVPLARQWLSSVGSVRPSDVVQIGAGSHGDLTTTATAQGVQVSATTGAALPYGAHAVHSEPELVRDVMFVHDNC